MINKKYVIATIQIPMEISESGNYESLMDYVSVEFTKCSELPKKKPDLNTSINDSYKNIIAELFSINNEKTQEHNNITSDLHYSQSMTDKEINPITQNSLMAVQDEDLNIQQFKLFVKPSEILQKKRSKNTSFKSSTDFDRKHHSFTAKNRNFI